jgi:quercetin dioxygenase-like cupin family protein
MGTETFNTKTSFLKDNGSLNDSLITFDLPTIVEKIKHEHSWKKGDLYTRILLNNTDKQIVLAALHEGTEIESFQSNDSVTFHIIEGKLKFRTRKESVILEKGQLLTLYENTKYSLTTREKTIFLLTIAYGILQPVEN